jgi:predicted HTH domain antitoxin
LGRKNVKKVRYSFDEPDEASGQRKQAVQSCVDELLCLELWKQGDMSTRQAAEALGLTYREFLDLLADRGIPVEDGEFDPKAIEEAQKILTDGRK